MVIYCEKKIKALTQLVNDQDHNYNTTFHSVSDSLTRGAMKSDFCEAKYVTDHSVSALLTRGAIENDFCTATELTASESEQPTQPVKIAELMELNTFVHHYSERTRQYATQIERLRERSNQLRAEAAQLLHRHPLNEWHTR